MAEEEEEALVATLHPTVIFNILTRLPVKSLVRFQALSKEIFSLINSPGFTLFHLTRSSLNPTLLISCLDMRIPISQSFHIHLIDENSFSPQNFRLPFLESLVYVPKIISSSRGLLCIDISLRYATKFILFNPATGRDHCLPSPLIDESDSRFWMVSTGFCYNNSRYDFNLVRIVIFQASSVTRLPDVRAEMYSWRTDSWREFDPDLTYRYLAGYSFQLNQHGVWVDGSIHWSTIKMVSPFIYKRFLVYFNIDREEFNSSPMPEEYNTGYFRVQLMSNKGALVVAFISEVLFGEIERIDLWAVFDLDFNSKQWLKWLRLSQMDEMVLCYPVLLWKDREMIMRCHNENGVRIFLMNLLSMEPPTSLLLATDPAIAIEVYEYQESLMPVCGRR